jgi:hypothetical protein
MKTRSILAAVVAAIISLGIATRDDAVRADTPSAVPDPNGDETELACRHQNIFLVVCPNGSFESDCTAGCPQCAPSCGTVRTQCDAACSVTCTSTVIGNC